MSHQTGPVTADAREHTAPSTSPSVPVKAPAHPAPVLTVGHADDPMERLADQMADRAVARLDASEPHRHSPGCGHLRRSVAPAAGPATIGLEGGSLDADASAQIERLRGGGQSLPTEVRRRMEGAFGTSLSHVRVHTGPQAARLSSAMQASAFTTGSDVFFGAGQYDPTSPAGEHVLAHELAHVVTEGSGGVRRMVIRRGIFDKVKSLKARLFGSDQKKGEAAAVKNSKKVEKAELAHHQQERVRGNQGREQARKEIYGEGPTPTAPVDETPEQRKDRLKQEFTQQGEQWTKYQQLQERFNDALKLELATFQQLVEENTRSGGKKTEEELAQEAYAKVWLETKDEQLRAVRPPRETAAERLVRQVRVAQTGAAVREEQDQNLQDSVKRGGMLSKTVEGAYEHMVVLARRKQRAARRRGVELSDEDARKAVRPEGVKYCQEQARIRKHKVPRELPQEGSALDKAAWEAAAERVDLRHRKRLLDEEAMERLQSQLTDGRKAKDHANDTDDVAGASKIELVTGIANTVAGLAETGGEKVAEAPEQAGKVKALLTGTEMPTVEERDEFETPRDMFEQVTDGVQAAGGLLSNLSSIVTEGLAMARHLKAALTSDDPWEGVKYMKANLGLVDGMVNGASNAATLAKSIKPALSKNVAEVTPIFGVYSAAIGVARNVLDVAMAGRRQHETNTALWDARVRTKGNEADVMVWPLMKMSQAHTKSLENNVWALGMGVYNLVVALGEAGTLGGAGVPKALQTGGKVLNKIHEFGHYLADQILTWQAKRAKKLSAVMHLEGAAQDELRYHPGTAVDAIIMRAVDGDEKAVAYLCNYYVDGKRVTPELIKRIDKVAVKPQLDSQPGDKISADTGPGQIRGGDDVVLTKIRQAVLDEMNMDADPKSLFDDIREGYKSAKGLFGLKEKWRQTGEMAEVRNAHAEDEGFAHTKRSDRGIGWRLKMMLKGQEKFGRSVAKTQVLKSIDDGKAAEQRAQDVKAGKLLPDGVACAVGDKMLGLSPTVAEAEKFFESLTINELETELDQESRRNPPRNSPGWIEVMQEELRKKRQARRAKFGGSRAQAAKAGNQVSPSASQQQPTPQKAKA